MYEVFFLTWIQNINGVGEKLRVRFTKSLSLDCGKVKNFVFRKLG